MLLTESLPYSMFSSSYDAHNYYSEITVYVLCKLPVDYCNTDSTVYVYF